MSAKYLPTTAIEAEPRSRLPEIAPGTAVPSRNHVKAVCTSTEGATATESSNGCPGSAFGEVDWEMIRGTCWTVGSMPHESTTVPRCSAAPSTATK